MEIIAQRNKILKYGVVLLLVAFVTSCKAPENVSTSKKTGSKELSDSDNRKFQAAWFNGLKAKTLGNYGRAMGYFERCLQLNKEADAVYYEVAKLNEFQQNYVVALENIEKAYQLSPTNRWYRDYLAKMYDKNTHYEKAIEIYVSLIESHPNSLEYYYELGNMYLYTNQIKKAVEVFDRVEEKVGVSEEVSLHKYKLLVQSGDKEGAKKEIHKLIEFNPAEVRYYGMLANMYREEGDLVKAIETFEKLKNVYPEEPLIRLSLSDYYNEGGEHEKAFEEVKTAFQSKQLGIDDRVRILMQYYQLSEKKIDEREKAYVLLGFTENNYPEEAKTYAVYGDFLIRDNKLKEAREKYRKSIALDNSKFLVWRQLLFINSDLNDVDAMLEDSGEAMNLFPSQPLVYFFNGISNLQKDNYSEAAFALEQGQGLVVDNPGLQGQFYSNLGDAYYRLDKLQLAWLNYERALKINPNNIYVLNNYAYYLSLKKANLDLAKEMSYKTVRANPNNATYLDTYAWILFQLEEYQEAKEFIERAIENGGNEHAEILVHYGDILMQLGDKDAAVANWRKAVEKGMQSQDLENKIKESQVQ